MVSIHATCIAGLFQRMLCPPTFGGLRQEKVRRSKVKTSIVQTVVILGAGAYSRHSSLGNKWKFISWKLRTLIENGIDVINSFKICHWKFFYGTPIFCFHISSSCLPKISILDCLDVVRQFFFSFSWYPNFFCIFI